MTSGIEPRRALIALIATLLLFSGVPAAAAETRVPAPWDIEQLMRTLAQVKHAQGRFVERKHLAILDQPLEFSGTLVYTAPGRLVKTTLRPRPEIMTVDADRLVIENPSRKQRRSLSMQEYPVVWAFVESIRSTLAGDLPTLNRFYRVTLEGSASQWRLQLLPREAAMQAVLREIRIGGAGNRVRTVEIFETVGNRSEMTITEDPA